jgi:hypothetical protein
MNDLLPLKIYKKNKGRQRRWKKREEKKVIQFMVSTLMLANWVQIWNWRYWFLKPFKFIILIYFLFFIFNVVQTCSKFGFWFQSLYSSKIFFWLKQLHVNHKSQVYQPIIMIYYNKVLKTLRFFCAHYHFRMHDSHSSAFMFHPFIQQPHFKANLAHKRYFIYVLKHESTIINKVLYLYILIANCKNLKFQHLVSYEKNTCLSYF